VLPPEEYAAEHLPGAVNVPLKQLDAETTAQLDQHISSRRELGNALAEADSATAPA
jgi:rhodanese-related sulfurtransferase